MNAGQSFEIAEDAGWRRALATGVVAWVGAARTLRTGSVAATVLAVIFLFHAFQQASFFSAVKASLKLDDADYVRRRTDESRGLDIRTLAAELNARLPSSTPVALDDGLKGDFILNQRLPEQLYPRRIDEQAPQILRVGSATGDPLLTWSGQAIALDGEPASVGPGSRAQAADLEPLEVSWRRFVLAVAGLLGWGWAGLCGVRRLLRIPAARPLGMGAAVVSAAAMTALAAFVATALHRHLPFSRAVVLGLGAGALTAWTQRRGWRRWTATLAVGVRHWETWLFALAGLGLLLRIAHEPVLGWDGRSIWLFHAKQVFVQGGGSMGELLHPEYAFSHPGYPPLFPAWMAAFAGLGGRYDERMATLGIPALFVGTLAAIWSTSRRVAGRWPGAAFTGALLLLLTSSVVEGYADSYLTLFLVLFFLAMADGDDLLAWMAALCASLTKREGLFLAAIAAAVQLAPHVKGGAIRLRHQARWLLWLVPGLAYAVWIKAVGVKDSFDKPELGPSTELLRRVGIIYDYLSPLALERPVMVFGLAATVVYAVLRRHRTLGVRGQPAVRGAVMGALFGVATMMVTPMDVNWHVGTALGRLLMHPAVLAVVAALLEAA